MDIQTRKIEFVQEFLKLENEELISALEEILHKNQSQESEGNLKPFSVQKLNGRISQSEKDFENGRFKTTSELLAKY